MAKKKTKKELKELDPYKLEEVSNHLETTYNFGFTPIVTPTYFKKSAKGNSDFVTNRLSYLSFFIEHDFHKRQGPYMFSYELPLKSSGKRKSPKNIELALEVSGGTKGVSDALVIKTAVALLTDEGHKDIYVEINSLGDKESFAKLEKDLVAYYRKNINALPASLRQSFKKDIWNILRTTDSRMDEFRASAPQPMSSLSDVSRKHFKEVLEYLEVLDIPYRINPTLIGEKGVNVHTIFEIKQESKGKKDDIVLGKGGRYNGIGREIGTRKEIPGVTVELSFPRKKKVSKVDLTKVKKPDLFFIQLGFEARLQSLNVIDLLRKNKIKVGHALTRDKITAQMIAAEKLNVSNLIIMGQREAIEKSVVIREMQTRTQTGVAVDDLVKHLKKLKKTK